MSHRSFLMLLSFTLLSACADPTPTATESVPTPSSRPIKQEVTRTTAAVPERFSAALPASSAAMKDWANFESSNNATYPPLAYVGDLLESGDAEMFERLAGVSMKVAADDVQAWGAAWHAWLSWRDLGPGFCAAGRPAIEAAASTLRLALVGPYAGQCAGADARALILRADTPDWAVVAWFSDTGETKRGGPMAYDVRINDILRAALENASDAQQARDALMAIDRTGDAAGIDAALALIAARPSSKALDNITQVLTRSKHAQARAIGVAACQRVSSDAAQCTRSFDGPNGDYVEEDPEIIAKLKARAKQLRAVGFTKVEFDQLEQAYSAGEMLVQSGHAYWFDVETGTFPNEHDSLLRSLAALIRPRLDGVIFEEIAPGIDDEPGQYLLRAYVDGQRLETVAENLGDWYDVDAVLRLLDAVLLERKASERFLLLETEDQTATVVAADTKVLQKALAEGLIAAGDAGAAEALGKDFEARVKASLR